MRKAIRRYSLFASPHRVRDNPAECLETQFGRVTPRKWKVALPNTCTHRRSLNSLVFQSSVALSWSRVPATVAPQLWCAAAAQVAIHRCLWGRCHERVSRATSTLIHRLRGLLFVLLLFVTAWQWRTEGGGLGCSNSPPPKFWRPSKIVPNSTRLWKLLKIAEFRTPTHQDVRKKGSKILKLPRFAIVLH